MHRRQEPGSPAAAQRALLNRYCVTCHNQRLKTAGLTLDDIDVANVGDNPVVWEKVVQKLHAGLHAAWRPSAAGRGLVSRA